jgi:lysozyme
MRMAINRGDWEEAAEGFMKWTKGGGKVLPGLVRRRQAEVALFLS